MENEEAKFALVNGITIEEYINKKVQEKLEKIVDKINMNFSSHTHNIIIMNNYGSQITLTISTASGAMKIEKGIDY
mgnify:CR=1 FL=1